MTKTPQKHHKNTTKIVENLRQKTIEFYNISKARATRESWKNGKAKVTEKVTEIIRKKTIKLSGEEGAGVGKDIDKWIDII